MTTTARASGRKLPASKREAAAPAFPVASGVLRTALDDLRANFDSPTAQGPPAYADQMLRGRMAQTGSAERLHP